MSIQALGAASIRRFALFLLVLSAAAVPASPQADSASVLPLPAQAQTANSSHAPSQAVPPGATPKGISAEAWTRIMADVQARAYAVQADRSGTLRAGNPAQNLSAEFTPRGVMLTPASPRMRHRPGQAAKAPPPAAPFELRTRSVNGTAAQAATPVASAARVEYRHPGYTEWYVNDAKGFEQGWMLEAPAAGGKAPLIRIAVSGARTVAEGADAIRIEDRSGKHSYRYAGLKVTDAAQRVLPARLRLSGAGIIEIAVDDRGAQYPVTVDPTMTAAPLVVTLTTSLSDPGPVVGAGFGVALAVNGDTLVVGASGVNDQGAAYIFNRNQGGAGMWGLAASLSDPVATYGDYFGSSVAVNGDTVVVGAGDTGKEQGAAYIYSRNQGGAGLWGMVASLKDPLASPLDEFGSSVAVDGDTVVVGAQHYDGSSQPQGAAYVYARNQGGADLWGLAASLSDPSTTNDHFGNSVAVDGDNVVVGASGASDSLGATYIYSRNQGGSGLWGLAAKLTAPPTSAYVDFGDFVALSGDTMVVEAEGTGGYQGAAFIYGRNQGGAGLWGLVATLRVNGYGYLALNSGTMMIGEEGTVYVYNRNQGGADQWGLVATLNDPNPASDDAYAGAVAIGGDTLVVGAFNSGASYQGAAYIYDIGGGSYTQAASITDPGAKENDSLGSAVAVDGDTVVVGADGFNGNQGAAYIYSRNQGGAGLWGLAGSLSDPAAKASDDFGCSVAVNGDTVLVGADGVSSSQGAAYVYSRTPSSGAGDGSGVWALAASLSDPATSSGDAFGAAVAVNGDTAVVGAYGSSASQGAAYIYSRNQGGAGTWGLADSLGDPAAASSDDFGNAVSVNGDTVAVGAYGTSGGKGAAYVYSRTPSSGAGDGSGVWALAASLSDPGAKANDAFGHSVAVDGDTLLVGADGVSSSQGAAYIYGRNQGGTGLWGLAASLSDPGASANDNFGESVAVNGNTAVVGAGGFADGRGAAYVFSRNQGGTGLWGQLASLSDPGMVAKDEFGNAVNVDGETIVVGANGAASGQGSTYVYSLIANLTSVSLAPVSLNFAPQAIGSTSAGQTLTLTNTGSNNLIVRSLSISPAGDTNNPADFSVSANNCGSPVPPGGNCTLQIVFKPNGFLGGAGAESATLNIPSNVPASTNTIALSGTAVAPPPPPTNLVATAENNQVVLSWTASAGATDYYVFYGTSPGGETTKSVAVTSTFTTIAGLSNGMPYYFVVKAYNHPSALTSAASNEATATPAVVPAPTNLTAMAGNNQVALSWAASYNDSDYYVFYGTTSGGETTKSAAITGTSITIAGLSDGTTYYFVVKAYNHGSGITSAASNEAPATPAVVPAPANLAATEGNEQVTLNWSASSGASEYYVFYGTTSGGETTQSAAVTSTSTTISGLSNGTTYYFVVKAYNQASGITSARSNEVSAMPVLALPAAPTNFEGSSASFCPSGCLSAFFNWTASAANEAASYNIYAGTTSGGESGNPFYTGITGTRYQTGYFNVGDTYYFKIAGVNSIGIGPPSAEIKVTFFPPAPSLYATAGDGQVMLNWTASPGASDYYVYYSTSPGGATTKSAAVIGTSTTITGLSSGTTYYFVVEAYDHSAAISSAPSNQVSATPN